MATIKLKQEIYNFLKNSNCCDICCLRYLKQKGDEYNNPKNSLENLGVVQCILDEDSECIVKKFKHNPCVLCLGFFSDDLQEQLISEVRNHPDLARYENDGFLVALSYPICLQIRQFSMWLALLEKFGESVIGDTKPPDAPLKEAAKLVFNPKLTKSLGKKYNQNGIMINIYLGHEEEVDAMLKLQTLKNELFIDSKLLSKQKGWKNEMTRGFFERYFLPNVICADTYKKNLSVPPDVPLSCLKLEKVTFQGPTIFVAGRYRKFSRELSHSPWVLHGKRVMEDSIEELIVQEVAAYFGITKKNVIFSSSGREDVDVRCLGKGRPFVLEISDAKLTKLPEKIAAQMEIATEQSGKISVHNLQIVNREEVTNLRQGEEKKRKFYRALCTLKEPATVEIMEKLTIPEGFQIEQITPIRVLHRRPLLKRPRRIYSLRGFLHRENPKLIILDVVTQAGTYVKELVHGDFGRTMPNVSSIIGQWIDIQALDVVGIDLDWPKEIDNRSSL